MMLMQNQFPTTSRHYYPQSNRYPDAFIQSFSTFPVVLNVPICRCPFWGMPEWVSARFSPSPNHEHLLALGAEDGLVGVCNVKELLENNSHDYELSPSSTFFTGKKDAIYDLCFIPSSPNKLISLSGKTIVLCDIEQKTYLSFINGHSKSVRCASIWHENLSLLVTGGQDGRIIGWDLRDALTSHTDLGNAMSITKARTYYNAHPTHERPASITGLLHYGENYIISGSSSASSGLRIWDLRYMTCTKPLRTLILPQQKGENKKTCWGVASLCWDRYHSSLFAACTDNTIHEYVPMLNSDMPVRTLLGQNIDSFQIQCMASPISDHLLCGSTNESAFIWDLQEGRPYRQNDNLTHPISRANFLPNPKFALNGHEYQVETVQWSARGNYILTLGPETPRIWKAWTEKKEQGYPNEILIDDRPVKLAYPTPLEKYFVHLPDSKCHEQNYNTRPSTSSTTLQKSPLRILENFPALHIKNPELATADFIGMKSPKRLVIKANTFMTPAIEIPKVDSTENLCVSETKRTSRRNLNTHFQQIQKTPGSSGNKRKGRPTTSDSGKRPNISRRSLILQQSPTPSAPATAKTIEQYFSPSTSKEKPA